MLPASDISPALRGVLTGFGVVSAALYASGLAFGAESLARTTVELLYFEEDRYRLLARNMSDVISRHSRNGAVQFISPAVEAMLGAPVARLQGHGLFDRVHVADRPAYLTALSDAARGGAARSVEFRLRRDSGRGQNNSGRLHLGRNALSPARRAGLGRSRGRRRDARRHRPEDRRSRRSSWRGSPPSRPTRQRPASLPP